MLDEPLLENVDALVGQRCNSPRPREQLSRGGSDVDELRGEVLVVGEFRKRHDPQVAVPPTLTDYCWVWFDWGDGDTGGQVRAYSHRAGMVDDLNLHRLVTETGQDDAVEHVSLQEGTSPTDVSALVVERFRFDLVHGLLVLLVSQSDGTLAVGVDEHFEVAAVVSPVWPHLVEHLRDRLALFSKLDQR